LDHSRISFYRAEARIRTVQYLFTVALNANRGTYFTYLMILSGESIIHLPPLCEILH